MNRYDLHINECLCFLYSPINPENHGNQGDQPEAAPEPEPTADTTTKDDTTTEDAQSEVITYCVIIVCSLNL